MIGCVKEGTEARDIGKVGVTGLGDALHQGGMSRKSQAEEPHGRCLRGKETRSRHWFRQGMVGFVVWRPMAHHVKVSPGWPQISLS